MSLRFSRVRPAPCEDGAETLDDRNQCSFKSTRSCSDDDDIVMSTLGEIKLDMDLEEVMGASGALAAGAGAGARAGAAGES